MLCSSMGAVVVPTSDGMFQEALEHFSFRLKGLCDEIHTVEARQVSLDRRLMSVDAIVQGLAEDFKKNSGWSHRSHGGSQDSSSPSGCMLTLSDRVSALERGQKMVAASTAVALQTAMGVQELPVIWERRWEEEWQQRLREWLHWEEKEGPSSRSRRREEPEESEAPEDEGGGPSEDTLATTGPRGPSRRWGRRPGGGLGELWAARRSEQEERLAELDGRLAELSGQVMLEASRCDIKDLEDQVATWSASWVGVVESLETRLNGGLDEVHRRFASLQQLVDRQIAQVSRRLPEAVGRVDMLSAQCQEFAAKAQELEIRLNLNAESGEYPGGGGGERSLQVSSAGEEGGGGAAGGLNGAGGHMLSQPHVEGENDDGSGKRLRADTSGDDPPS